LFLVYLPTEIYCLKITPPATGLLSSALHNRFHYIQDELSRNR
jgi:hypothetical protein